MRSLEDNSELLGKQEVVTMLNCKILSKTKFGSANFTSIGSLEKSFVSSAARSFSLWHLTLVYLSEGKNATHAADDPSESSPSSTCMIARRLER